MYKKIMSCIMLSLCLASCSKSFFFGEKGGADAYSVGALEPLKMPNHALIDLPKPKEKQLYKRAVPSKVKKASDILRIQPDEVQEKSVANLVLKEKIKQDVDFDAFDARMHAEYAKEEAARNNSVMDSLLGRESDPIDPVLNTKDDDSILAF